MSRYVFLSYSRTEADIARKLRTRLQGEGFNVWMDESNLPPGVDWRGDIEKAIGESQAMVVALSPKAAESPHVKEEIDLALQGGVQLFPFVVEISPNRAVPDSLKHLQYTDASGKKFNSGVKTLVQALCDHAAVRHFNTQRRMRVLAVCLLLAIVAGALILTLVNRRIPPIVSLISARYMAANYDPHVIDFRTAATDGIPFSDGQSLILSDIWIWASENAPDYHVRADLSVNGERVGSSDSVPVQAGINRLGDITPERDTFEGLSNAWLIQPNWEVLDLNLLILDGENIVHQEQFPIRHNANGLSRLQDMPLASIVSISYSINDGPARTLDIAAIMPNGLSVQTGDKLALNGVWYNSGTETEAKKFILSAYITHDGFREDTYQTSPEIAFAEGMNVFELNPPFTWPIEADYRFWVISLERNDGALLDRLLIPVNPAA